MIGAEKTTGGDDTAPGSPRAEAASWRDIECTDVKSGDTFTIRPFEDRPVYDLGFVFRIGPL